ALINLAFLAIPGAVLAVVSWFAIFGVLLASSQNPDTALIGGLSFIVVAAILAFLALVTGMAFFSAGLHRAALKQLRGERVQVSDLFSGGRYILRFLGSNILIAALALIGFLMCIIPGLLVTGVFIFTPFIIVDRDCGVIEAMRTSYERCKDGVLWYTLLGLVLGIMNQIGSYVLYVGMLVTFPLMFTITAVAYRDTFDLPGMRPLRPENRNQAGYKYPGYPSPGYGNTPPSFMPPAGPLGPTAQSGTPTSPQAGPTRSQAVPCPSCGTPLPNTAKFCGNCGNPTHTPWGNDPWVSRG
ncbi:MAG TPA: zinc-ribbon domain-containing protein, partial [Blastocatellia bacterium]